MNENVHANSFLIPGKPQENIVDGPGPNDLSGLETLAVTAAVLSQPAEIPRATSPPVTNVTSLNGGNGQSLATAEKSSSNDAQSSLEGDATAALVPLNGGNGQSLATAETLSSNDVQSSLEGDATAALVPLNGGNGQSLATAEKSSSNDAQSSLEGDATAALVPLNGGNGQSLATQSSLEGDATAALVSLQGESSFSAQDLQPNSLGAYTDLSLNENPRFDVNSESEYRDQSGGNASNVSASLPPTAVTECALPTNVQNDANSNVTSNLDRVAVQIDSTSIQPTVAAAANNLGHPQDRGLNQPTSEQPLSEHPFISHETKAKDANVPISEFDLPRATVQASVANHESQVLTSATVSGQEITKENSSENPQFQRTEQPVQQAQGAAFSAAELAQQILQQQQNNAGSVLVENVQHAAYESSVHQLQTAETQEYQQLLQAAQAQGDFSYTTRASAVATAYPTPNTGFQQPSTVVVASTQNQPQQQQYSTQQLGHDQLQTQSLQPQGGGQVYVQGSSDLQQFLQQPGQQYRVIQQQPYVVQQQQQQLVQQQQQVVQQQPQQQQKMIQHGMEDMVPQYINVNGKLVKGILAYGDDGNQYIVPSGASNQPFQVTEGLTPGTYQTPRKVMIRHRVISRPSTLVNRTTKQPAVSKQAYIIQNVIEPKNKVISILERTSTITSSPSNPPTNRRKVIRTTNSDLLSQITEYASYVPPRRSSYKESVVPQTTAGLDHLSSVVQNTINSPVVVQSTTAAVQQLNSGEQNSGRYSVIQSQQSQIVDISGLEVSETIPLVLDQNTNQLLPQAAKSQAAAPAALQLLTDQQQQQHQQPEQKLQQPKQAPGGRNRRVSTIEDEVEAVFKQTNQLMSGHSPQSKPVILERQEPAIINQYSQLQAEESPVAKLSPIQLQMQAQLQEQQQEQEQQEAEQLQSQLQELQQQQESDQKHSHPKQQQQFTELVQIQQQRHKPQEQPQQQPEQESEDLILRLDDSNSLEERPDQLENLHQQDLKPHGNESALPQTHDDKPYEQEQQGEILIEQQLKEQQQQVAEQEQSQDLATLEPSAVRRQDAAAPTENMSVKQESSLVVTSLPTGETESKLEEPEDQSKVARVKPFSMKEDKKLKVVSVLSSVWSPASGNTKLNRNKCTCANHSIIGYPPSEVLGWSVATSRGPHAIFLTFHNAGVKHLYDQNLLRTFDTILNTLQKQKDPIALEVAICRTCVLWAEQETENIKTQVKCEEPDLEDQLDLNLAAAQQDQRSLDEPEIKTEVKEREVKEEVKSEEKRPKKKRPVSSGTEENIYKKVYATSRRSLEAKTSPATPKPDAAKKQTLYYDFFCNISGCRAKFRNYHSLQKHLTAKHPSEILAPPEPLSKEEPEPPSKEETFTPVLGDTRQRSRSNVTSEAAPKIREKAEVNFSEKETDKSTPGKRKRRESNEQIGRTPKRQRPTGQSDPSPVSQTVCTLVSDELEAEVPNASDATPTNVENHRLEQNIENELFNKLEHIDESQATIDRKDDDKEDTARIEGKGGDESKKKSRLARSLEIDMVVDTFNPSSRRRSRVKPQDPKSETPENKDHAASQSAELNLSHLTRTSSKSKSPDPGKKRIATEVCCENELKTSSSLKTSSNLLNEAPLAKDVLQGHRSFAEILFQRVMKGSVEANDAFKILQRRVEGGITFKQFEAEYAAFFIRKKEEERLTCQKEVRVQIENVLDQPAAASRKQRSQSTGTNVRSRSPCLDSSAENSIREDKPSGTALRSRSPALLRSRSPTIVASKKSAIVAVSKKSAISRLLDLKLVEAKLNGLVASQEEMPVLNQEEQTILDSIRQHIDKL